MGGVVCEMGGVVCEMGEILYVRTYKCGAYFSYIRMYVRKCGHHLHFVL